MALEDKLSDDRQAFDTDKSSPNKSSTQFLKDILEVSATGVLGILAGGYNIATGGFNAGLGLLNYGSVAGSFAAAHAIFERDKVSPKTLMDKLKLGGMYTPAIFAAFSLINPYLAGASLVGKFLTAGVGMAMALPAVLSHYLASEDVIKKHGSITDYLYNAIISPVQTIGGTVKYVASNIYQTVKYGALLVPFVMADLALVPFEYQLLAASVLRFGLGAAMSMKDKKNATPAKQAPNYDPGLGGAPSG